MNEKIKILGISGSLRKGSYNSALLRAVKELSSTDAEIEIVDIGGLPLFNQDNEKEPPQAVVELKEKIKAVDAVLFVSPEYNYSFSGVIKNAIDWGTRPWGNNSFGGKVAGIMGASSGTHGTSRMQYQLRQVLNGAGMRALERPEVFVGMAQSKFDDDGLLVDEETKAKVKEFLTALVTLAGEIK